MSVQYHSVQRDKREIILILIMLTIVGQICSYRAVHISWSKISRRKVVVFSEDRHPDETHMNRGHVNTGFTRVF